MVARTRVLGGDPPTAMRWQFGKNLFSLAEDGLLNDLDEVAGPGGWDKVPPPQVQAQVKYKGKYYLAPIGLHGRNWLWSNPAVFEKVGVPVPKTWAEVNAVADKIRAAGFIPLALGDQSWQELIVFETVVLEVGGPEMFKKVAALDADTLSGAKMVEVFKQLEKIKGYLDPGSPSRDWNITAGLMLAGKAAMFVHGDWAKGEFTGVGKVPGKDVARSIFPVGKGAFIYGGDGFAANAVKDEDQRAARLLWPRRSWIRRFRRSSRFARVRSRPVSTFRSTVSTIAPRRLTPRPRPAGWSRRAIWSPIRRVGARCRTASRGSCTARPLRKRA